MLGRGLAVNESLRVLKVRKLVALHDFDAKERVRPVTVALMLTVDEQVGNNPMSTAGCYAICAALLRNQQGSGMRRVDLSVQSFVTYPYMSS